MMESQFGLEEHDILHSPLEGHIDNGILDEFVSLVINSEKNDGVRAALARRNGGDKMVSESFGATNTWKINHLWEDNSPEDLHVVEPSLEAKECMPEKNVGLIVRADDNYMEPDLVDGVQESDIAVLKPSEALPKNQPEMARASKAKLIPHHGGSRKVRTMSKIA
ncbi:hypothetical protein V6N12_047324 [Hibiscus sabdariffa]|uniref:Uncharacterized protein n=1 Tax=Hibiscus sabdariffa TaxID=183260 RepID=A0ABR2DAI7_9ROSI